MGIETGVAGLLSAAGTAAATAVAGALVSKALAPKPQQQQVKPLDSADKPPQAEKAPDINAIAKKNALAASASGALSGNSSTLLTGSQGVNPGSLNLGTSTLLGQ